MQYLHNAHVKQVPVTVAWHILWLCEWRDGNRYGW